MVRVVSAQASFVASHSRTVHDATPPAHVPFAETVRTRFVASSGGRQGTLFVSHWICSGESE